MNSIIRQKEEILKLIEDFGVELDNVQSIHLIGSHFWGYASEAESDIDLLIIDKDYVNTDEIAIEDMRINAIRSNIKGLRKNMIEGNFWKFLISQKNFYPLYGHPVTMEFESTREQTRNYFQSKYERDVETIINLPIKSGFHTVMKFIQYLNHTQNIGSYKLTDFSISPDLNEKEKEILEKAYIHTFNRTDADQSLKIEIKDIAQKLFELI